jgi:hypothetical protein
MRHPRLLRDAPAQPVGQHRQRIMDLVDKSIHWFVSPLYGGSR